MEFLYGFLLGLIIPTLLILLYKFNKSTLNKNKEVEEDLDDKIEEENGEVEEENNSSATSLNFHLKLNNSNNEYKTYRVIYANGDEDFIKTTKTLDELTKELYH